MFKHKQATASDLSNFNLNGVEKTLQSILEQLRLQRDMPSVPLEVRRLAAQDCAKYIWDNFSGYSLFKYRWETLKFALRNAEIDGYFLEFGVHSGETINSSAKLRPEEQFWGFDSFEGLPEDWTGTDKQKGDFDLKGSLPDVPSNVTLVKGWFEDSIPKWKETHDGPISYCHIDCDLYSSTVTVFKELESRFRPGTILLFDEYFGYPDWRNGEHKAFLEMIDRTGFNWKPKAISHMALVVQLYEKST